MNKNTKTLLTIGAVAAVGYIVWQQMSKPKPAFANATAKNRKLLPKPPKPTREALNCSCEGIRTQHDDGSFWIRCSGRRRFNQSPFCANQSPVGAGYQSGGVSEMAFSGIQF